jgi:hypothetical protein
MSAFAVEIGGIPIRLLNNDEQFLGSLQRRFAGFLRPSEEGQPFLKISLHSPARVSNDDIAVSECQGSWHIRRGDFRATWNPQEQKGEVLQNASPYALDTTLRIIHSIFLSERGGFLVHASSAIRNGNAFFFAGVSGAGKTTLTRLAPPGVTILTDEISYIRRYSHEYRAFGTPFAGEFGKPGTNTSAPVKAWFFLVQGSENRLEPIADSAGAVRLLMRNILFFAQETQAAAGVFNNACDFVARVPGYRMIFKPEMEAWDLIR